MYVTVSDKHKKSLSSTHSDGRWWGKNSAVPSLFSDGGGYLAYELKPHRPINFESMYVYVVLTKTVGLDVIQGFLLFLPCR